MNSSERTPSSGKARVVKKFVVGYMILLAMPLVVFAVLLFHGLKIEVAAKGMLTGAVPFTVLLAAMTYQFIKELRATRLDEPRDS